MIQSWADQGTKDIFKTLNSKASRKTLDVKLHTAAKKKLDILDFAKELKDLRSPPGSRLEALAGNLQGFHSIRINDQWRIVFRWSGSAPEDVRICDYH